jgi:hypothetical protein
MNGSTQLRNPDITHFIPAARGWRIALSEHDGEPNFEVMPIIGWVVCDGQPRIQPVFHHCGAAITVSTLTCRDAYEILTPGQRVTRSLRLRLQTEAAD